MTRPTQLNDLGSNAELAMTDAEADAAQNWKGMDGAIAWHLIERHADGWSDVGSMMNAWLRANGGTVANAPELTRAEGVGVE